MVWANGANVAGSSPTGGILARLRECVNAYNEITHSHICEEMPPVGGRTRNHGKWRLGAYPTYKMTRGLGILRFGAFAKISTQFRQKEIPFFLGRANIDIGLSAIALKFSGFWSFQNPE